MRKYSPKMSEAVIRRCSVEKMFTLRHEYSPANLLHIFSTPFPRAASEMCYFSG